MTRPDFEESRHYPAESCTEIGADAGCGERGSGLGPWEWLAVGVALFCIVVALALPYLSRGHV